MPTFEELLAASLGGVNASFQRTVAELHEEIAKASQVIARLSDGKAELMLNKRLETESSVCYEMYLKTVPNAVDLGVAFWIDTKGYPIRTASLAQLHRPVDRAQARELTSREDVRTLLDELASNPDSPLVIKLAFFLRTQAAK
jgi:hypothetical protein